MAEDIFLRATRDITRHFYRFTEECILDAIVSGSIVEREWSIKADGVRIMRRKVVAYPPPDVRYEVHEMASEARYERQG